MAANKETIKEMQASIAAMMTRFETLTVEVAALKAEAATKDVKKTKRASKAKSASSTDVEEKEKKPRVSKPSEAKDAWRALCDAVRAVHKKDAMKIAKILKDASHMKPTAEQIEAAIKTFSEGNHADVTMESAVSASEAEVEVEKPKKRGAKKAKADE